VNLVAKPCNLNQALILAPKYWEYIGLCFGKAASQQARNQRWHRNRFGRTGRQPGRPLIVKPVQVQRSNPNSLARFSLAHPSSAAARERKTRGAERRGYHGTAYGSSSSRGKHTPFLNTRSRHTLRCARYSTRERGERTNGSRKES
jgi:hypothetical protein